MLSGTGGKALISGAGKPGAEKALLSVGGNPGGGGTAPSDIAGVEEEVTNESSPNPAVLSNPAKTRSRRTALPI